MKQKTFLQNTPPLELFYVLKLITVAAHSSFYRKMCAVNPRTIVAGYSAVAPNKMFLIHIPTILKQTGNNPDPDKKLSSLSFVETLDKK